MFMFGINNTRPKVNIEQSIKRNATIMEGPNKGTLKNGAISRDIIGTRYDYGVVAFPREGYESEYDTLYQTITDPVESYPVSLPFGQGILSFDAYVQSVSDDLTYMGRKYLWDGMGLTVIAAEPQRYPGETWTPSLEVGSGVIKINGYSFPALVEKLTRTGTIKEGAASGRSITGNIRREIVGTFFSYQMTLNARTASLQEYDDLYYLITSPVNSVEVTVPYGQDNLTFSAYVQSASDSLLLAKNSLYLWGGLNVEFVAMEPKRRPL